MQAGPSYKNPVVRVSRREAESVLRALLAAGALDPTRQIVRGEAVLFPVLHDVPLPPEAQGRLAEGDALLRAARRTPHEEIVARLPETLRPHVPDKWEKLGDVVVLRLPEALRPHVHEVAAAYAEVLEVRCVLDDAAGVGGELREMAAEILLGDDPVTTHVENGVRYRFDASRIMFSSGNVAERTRTAAIDASGETVVDMFAGIGYFTLPLALHGGPRRLIAIEKSPLAHRYLEENVRLNGVEAVVEPWLGDNRDSPHEGIADRVLMGYFPGTARFLPKALAFLRPEGGRIHYHDTAPERSWKETMTRAFLDAARACGRVVAFEEARVVKGYAPGIVHALVVGRVTSAV